MCKAAGVDPFASDCASQAAAVDPAFANCCLTQTNDPSVTPVVEERAWSSPVWYRPEAIAGVEGGVDFGAAAGSDRLSLTIRLGELPADVDPAQQPLSLTVSDDDVIFTLTLGAGSMPRDSDRPRWVATDPAAAGLEAAVLELLPTGEASLTLHTRAGDLAEADRVDHIVEVALSIGSYRTSFVRRWLATGRHLGPASAG